ncbi:MAG: flagellar motor protein MotB [Vampirovibrionales bacterium]|nr:flagellar motor protein MotB [Vampirovibrionales bacterium]
MVLKKTQYQKTYGQRSSQPVVSKGLSLTANSAQGKPSMLSPGKGSGAHSLQRLETLEEELGHSAAYTGPHRWLIPYADLLTLLLGLFLAMLAMSARDNDFLTNINQELQHHLNKTQALVSQQAQQLKAYEALKATVTAVEQQTHTTGAITLLKTPEGVLIRLTDSLLFDSGSATLSPQAQQAVATLAQGLKQQLIQSGKTIRVEGHTDNTPIATSQYPSNWALSTARATTLVSALIQQQGLNPNQLSAAGYAQYRPIASNSSAQGRQQNRRVDIIVLDASVLASAPKAAVENTAGTVGIKNNRVSTPSENPTVMVTEALPLVTDRAVLE